MTPALIHSSTTGISLHIISIQQFTTHGFITNPQNEQFPVGLLAQLVVKSTAAALQRSWVQLPHKPELFSGIIFT